LKKKTAVPATAPAKAPEPMTVEIWPIDKVIPYPKNARTLSDRAVATVAASIQAFGWRQPIVVDAKGVIIVGHTRRLAGIKLGHTEVPVHVATNLTPAQVKAYRLMDNRSADESSWDIELVEAEMVELQALEYDLALTGFTEQEIGALFAGGGLTLPDAVPDPPEAPVSQLGDMWLLGTHRVLCGDSTAADAVARLVGADKADLVFTDPPYNVDYEGYTKDKLKIEGDARTQDEFAAFLDKVFASYKEAIKPQASLYVCHGSSFQREFQAAIEGAGFEIRTQIIWAKNTFGWGFARYKFQHEPIFYCHVPGQKDAWYGNKSQSTLWQVNKPAANRLHPTMKPIELIEIALKNSSQPADVVLDLFGGSGSTLIACEKTQRRALLMELDPKYVDVIVVRWQEYTGKTATLASGETFEQVKTARAVNPAPAKAKTAPTVKPTPSLPKAA
jgi:DNA modification methylase